MPGLSGNDENPYGDLRCTLPARPDTVPGRVRITITGDVAKVVIEGLPVAVMREVLVSCAGIHFARFTTQTSLGRPPSQGRFTELAHAAVRSRG